MQEGGIDFRTVVIAGDTPDVVCQNAISPGLVLLEHHGCRTDTELIGTKKIVGRCGKQENRPDAPDRIAGFRREEKALHGITEPRGIRRAARENATLVDDRKNGAGDDIPIVVQGNRNDRLEVQGESIAIAWTNAGFEISLQRHTDQVGHGI